MIGFVLLKIALIEFFENEADEWLDGAEGFITENHDGVHAKALSRLYYQMMTICDEAAVTVGKTNVPTEIGLVVARYANQLEDFVADYGRLQN